MAWNPFKKGKKGAGSNEAAGAFEPTRVEKQQAEDDSFVSPSRSVYTPPEPGSKRRLNSSPIRLSRRIGDIFYSTGKVTENDLEEAYSLSQSEGMLLGRALISMGKLKESEVLHCLEQQKLVTSVDIGRLKISEEVLRRVPDSIVHQHQFVPFDIIGETLCICNKSVLSFEAAKAVRDRTRLRVRTFDSLTGWESLRDCIDVYYPSSS